MKVSMKNSSSQTSQFFIGGTFSSSLISYGLVSNMFMTYSSNFNSLTYLFCVFQLNLSFSSICPSCLCLCVPHWLGGVAAQSPVSVCLNTIMTAVAACTAAWFTFSFMITGSAISICILCNSLYFVLFMSS